MKAWLVTWEWATSAAAVEEKVTAILSPLWSPERVAQVVELLYVRSCYDVVEMAEKYAKVRGSHPYEAEISKYSQITCGPNPHLFARKVEDLRFERSDETEAVTIRWTESMPREVEPGKVEVAKSACSFTRCRTGPLSEDVT